MLEPLYSERKNLTVFITTLWVIIWDDDVLILAASASETTAPAVLRCLLPRPLATPTSSKSKKRTRMPLLDRIIQVVEIHLCEGARKRRGKTSSNRSKMLRNAGSRLKPPPSIQTEKPAKGLVPKPPS